MKNQLFGNPPRTPLGPPETPRAKGFFGGPKIQLFSHSNPAKNCRSLRPITNRAEDLKFLSNNHIIMDSMHANFRDPGYYSWSSGGSDIFGWITMRETKAKCLSVPKFHFPILALISDAYGTTVVLHMNFQDPRTICWGSGGSSLTLQLSWGGGPENQPDKQKITEILRKILGYLNMNCIKFQVPKAIC